MNTGSTLKGAVLASGIALALPHQTHAQVSCLPIDRIDVSGVTRLKPAQLRNLVSGFEGKCLGLADLDQVLERLTLAYVDRAYVLSRAYFPEQDLSDRVLDIAVVEGQLEAIQLNGVKRPLQSRMVFPGMLGKPVNLRQVEQGLEQIQSMPRTHAQMEFVPGSKAGDSLLEVSVLQPKPFELRFTTKNHGNAPTGVWLSGFEGDVGNLFGFNEVIEFSVSKSLDPSPFSFGYDGDHNLSGTASISVPYGRWNFELAANASRYDMHVPGAISPIPVKGWSNSQTLTAKYLVDRDQKTQTTFEIALERKDAENFIQGVRIENSSRTLSNLRLSVGHTRPFWGGHFDATAFVEQGLRLFKAEDADSKPDGSPNAQYSLAGFEMSYDRPFQLGQQQLRWTSDLSGQISNDRLYAGEQFSIGGPSTVRGTRVALAAGSTGLFWRNEVSYALPKPVLQKGNLTFYGAVDWGWVDSDPDIGAIGGRATSGVIGARLDVGNFDLDLSYQQVLAVSNRLQKPEGEVFLEAAYRF